MYSRDDISVDLEYQPIHSRQYVVFILGGQTVGEWSPPPGWEAFGEPYTEGDSENVASTKVPCIVLSRRLPM